MEAQRLALFQELLKKKGIRLAPASITRRQNSAASSADACLSFAQQRLWFIHQLEQGRAQYHKPCGLSLHGVVDSRALNKSLQEIILRHEILRTVFMVRNDQPVQIVLEKLIVPMRHVDLSQLPASERHTELKRLSMLEIQQPFDLVHGPLLRITMFQVQKQEHILLLTLHHIIFDDWSLGVFMRELAALYQAYHAGKPSPLAELPLQYADFAVWQRAWLQGEILKQQMQYWQETLHNAPPVLEMPTDYPYPPRQDYQGAYLPIFVSQEIYTNLQVICQRSETTLFVVLLAAFQTLLYRYSGQEDIVVGTPIANRNRAETESLIGFFINTLALRTDLSGNPRFLELVQRVRTTTLGAYSHQDIPFEKLVEEFQTARALNRTPLFQVLFILHNVPVSLPKMPELVITPFEVEGEAVHFDLTLAFEETGQGLRGTLGYRTCLFTPTTMDHFIKHFHSLLENISANPQQRLAEIPLFAETEHYMFPAIYRSRHVEGPTTCLHLLFEEQAARHPDRCALVCDDNSISYQELNWRSNQVAHALRSLGVQQETPVGICLDRSAEMIIGLLGVLKAGGAYVPLDPSHPGERLASLLDAAQVRIVLTKTWLRERVAHSSRRTVCLDDWSTIHMFAPENLDGATHTAQLAYIIYTSGSTGKAKGVGVEHRQIVQYVRGVTETLHLASCQNFAQVSTFAADLGNTVLFPALCNGKCLHILSQEKLSSPDLFSAYCAEHSIDALKITPSHLLMLLTAKDPVHVIPLKHLILGGEAIQWSWIEHILEISPLIPSLTNHYGPTETTVGVLTYTIERDARKQHATILPIGRPLPNVQVYVLNVSWQHVPVGGIGELYIGGDGVTRGYLNQPDKTAEKFIPHPFSQQAGARLYRSGDKVRLRADGIIEFIGRIDYQIKLRGFRIEPGEVEAILCQYPAIHEAVVVAQGKETGEKSLAAYLVAHNDMAIGNIEVRRYLRDRLPEYMVPSTFIQLASLPRNAHGKLDRRALLQTPKMEVEVEEHKMIAPRDHLELQMMHIWEEVLGIQPISLTQNFFDLGGHSFSAVRIVQRIQQVFARHLPLAALFQYPTIEQLTAWIRQDHSVRQAPSCLVRMDTRRSTGEPFFFIHPIGGNVFCYQELCQLLEEVWPVYALQAQGLDGQQAPRFSIEEMASHYLQLIRSVQPEGPYRLGGWSFGGLVAFEIAQQLHTQQQNIAFLGLIDSTAPEENPPSEMAPAALLEAFAVDLGVQTAEPNDDLSRLTQEGGSTDASLSRLLDIAKRAQVVPPDVELPYIRHLWDVYQANRQALLRYRPEPYAGSAWLFRAVPSLAGSAQQIAGADWQRWVEQEVVLCPIVGDHYSILQMPGVKSIAEILKRALADDDNSAKD